MAPGPSPVGVKNIMDRVRGAAALGKLAREVKLLTIDRANHFVGTFLFLSSVYTEVIARFIGMSRTGFYGPLQPTSKDSL